MTVRTQSTRSRRKPAKTQTRLQRHLARYFPIWALLCSVLVLMSPRLLPIAASAALDVLVAVPGLALDAGEVVLDVAGAGLELAGDVASGVADLVSGGDAAASGKIAPLFTEEVAHWSPQIARWASEYGLDPNLLATVMQIESCGHPTVTSVAGAQGLFQVMPFHFAPGENYVDPETNAMRGAGVLNECLALSNGDAGMAMACYNGGPSVLRTPFNNWLSEPQRYYRWGTGIYADAQNNSGSSGTLDSWLAAGGSALCDRAAAVLDLD